MHCLPLSGPEFGELLVCVGHQCPPQSSHGRHLAPCSALQPGLGGEPLRLGEVDRVYVGQVSQDHLEAESHDRKQSHMTRGGRVT